MIMKRIILIIAFFVGLIPNLTDMCFESAYCVMGQSMYDELVQEGESHLPHCDLCDSRLVEEIVNSECIAYCFYCDSYCTICAEVYRKGHDGTHTCSNDNTEDDETPEYPNEPTNPSNPIVQYRCLTCFTICRTLQEKTQHTYQYSHYSFGIITK